MSVLRGGIGVDMSEMDDDVDVEARKLEEVSRVQHVDERRRRERQRDVFCVSGVLF